MAKELFVTKYRVAIIVGCVLLAAVMGIQLRNLHLDADPMALFPQDLHSRVNTVKIENIFGSNDMLFFIFETDDVLSEKTLRRVMAISEEFHRVKGVKEVLSLFDTKRIAGVDGSMIVEPAVGAIPVTAEERDSLRRDLAANELASEIVVSRDFHFTAVIVTLTLDAVKSEVFKTARCIVDSLPGAERVYTGGVPAFQTMIMQNIVKDLLVLVPAALFVILGVLFGFFGQLRGVLLPFGVILLSAVLGMSILPIMGWKLTIMSALLPILVIAFSNNYGLYLVARYKELCAGPEARTGKELATEVFKNLYNPILFSGTTTMVGILGLLSHVIVPARQIGIAASIAIGFSLVVSLGGIPAVLSLFKVPEIQPATVKKRSWPLLDKSLLHASGIIVRHPGAILASTAAIIALGILCATRLVVDTNQENLFAKNHPISKSTRIINDHFGGSQNISILFEGDIKDPVLLKKLERYKDTLRCLPGVGQVTSIADVLRIMSRALNDKDEPGYDRIPKTRDAVAQYLELYSMSGNPEDFERLVDFNYEKALLVLRINDGATPTVNHILRKIDTMIKEDKEVTMVGGYSAVFSEFANSILKGQIYSILFALCAITFLVMVPFRSAVAGLMASVPLIISIILGFGIMGASGIRLDIATVIITSIVIGSGVDFTLQFLWKYRSLLQQGMEYRGAVRETMLTTGRAITFNALCIVAGFSALFLSSMPPLRMLALLFGVLTLACMAGSLVVIPSLCLVLKPKFLEPINDRDDTKEAVYA
ncbi:MAG: RND family transporter [Chitinispirillaceae bacterium]|nr:RND family transporter [Chitinispirillaceae bacterium]